MKEYYTTGEVAKIFDITTKTIYNWDKEGTFVPETKNGEDRLYSREQIEKKLGKTIEQTIDPILGLDKKGIEALMWLGEAKHPIDFNKIEGETILQRYESFVMKMYQISSEIFRKTQIRHANWVLSSPEIMHIINLRCNHDSLVITNKQTQICYEGTLNSRWKLYSTPLLPPDIFIMGINIDNEIVKNKEAIAVGKFTNWVS